MTDACKIIDALCYVPTEEVVVDLVVSLPPQMARYLKDIFGPRVAPAMGLTAEELYRMKVDMARRPARGLARMKPCPPAQAFVRQLDGWGGEGGHLQPGRETPSGLKGLPNDYYKDMFAGTGPLHRWRGSTRSWAWTPCARSGSYDLGLRGISPAVHVRPPAPSPDFIPCTRPARSWTFRSGSTRHQLLHPDHGGGRPITSTSWRRTSRSRSSPGTWLALVPEMMAVLPQHVYSTSPRSSPATSGCPVRAGKP